MSEPIDDDTKTSLTPRGHAAGCPCPYCERDELRVRVNLLEAALAPLANIADQYEENNLDDARPEWVKRGLERFDLNAELYNDRGGGNLINLAHCFAAREALRGKQ